MPCHLESSLQCDGLQQIKSNKNVLALVLLVLIGYLSVPGLAHAQKASPDQDTLPALYKPGPTRDQTAAASAPNPGKIQGGPSAVQTVGSNPLNGGDIGSDSSPFLVDIENDGDDDLFTGAADGKTQESPELSIEGIPERFDLYQNDPNPFNPQTTIGYDIPEPVHVTIRVFDVLGRPVQVLVDEEVQAGKHEVHSDTSGLATGIYLHQMHAGTEVDIKKMILAK